MRNNQSYELLISTLSYLNDEPSTKTDEEISEIIEELEGDHISFLHENTINGLQMSNNNNNTAIVIHITPAHCKVKSILFLT